MSKEITHKYTNFALFISQTTPNYEVDGTLWFNPETCHVYEFGDGDWAKMSTVIDGIKYDQYYIDHGFKVSMGYEYRHVPFQFKIKNKK